VRVRDFPRSIPASAGETPSSEEAPARGWVHPRECGGNVIVGLLASTGVGPSPRVRGKRLSRMDAVKFEGSIPASAGETEGQRHSAW